LGDAVTYEGGFYYRTGNPLNPGYPPSPGSINASWTPVADRGAEGAQGAQGAQGASGPQGFQGANGADGAQGAQGAQGATGSQGAQGAQGFQGAAGAAQYWTESTSTASPNATVNTSQFTPNVATSNGDAVIAPKGTGALLAATPDNTTTGGNKRGNSSVDFQRSRTASDQIASGNNAAIVAGINNTASGNTSGILAGSTNSSAGGNSAVVAGSSNAASSGSSFIGAGFLNTTSGSNYAAILSGSQNTASGQASGIVSGDSNSVSTAYSFIGAGQSNTISTNQFAAILGGSSNSITASGATYSAIIGGQQASTRYYAEIAHASGQFAAVGDAQESFVVLRRSITAGAAATDLTFTGAAASASNTIVLANNSMLQFVIKVSARDTGATGQFAWWHIVGGVSRDASAATTALVGAAVANAGNSGGNSAGWTCAVQTNTTDGSLQILVAAPAGTGSVRFVASAQLTRVA